MTQTLFFQAPLSALMLACVIPFFEPVCGEGGIIYYWPAAAWVSFTAGHQAILIFSKKMFARNFPNFSKPSVYRQMFHKEAVLKNLVKLTRIHLYRSLYLIKLYAYRYATLLTLAQVLSCDFATLEQLFCRTLTGFCF